MLVGLDAPTYPTARDPMGRVEMPIAVPPVQIASSTQREGEDKVYVFRQATGTLIGCVDKGHTSPCAGPITAALPVEIAIKLHSRHVRFRGRLYPVVARGTVANLAARTGGVVLNQARIQESHDISIDLASDFSLFLFGRAGTIRRWIEMELLLSVVVV